ncbi:Membrane associated serine protease, rhomboid family [Pseudooceanicola antarcticus]|uniref:Membrane associated serine protease, rhomboid family n=1 Tax=Pseudooceanicola antarcticus TaxID=1247613 RepID=A0A285JBF8_9RHOB|nr:rhomboid family intramembrane serine protease [Pseudooceanicola antarcticus]PJE30963.1 rhomboid family intramembrane serine protease [Pseudooceanicola antarcticus]SNY57197.1 Membrane associated serine protease, rhomboid family [Pseudooceanicola antarcticus]
MFPLRDHNPSEGTPFVTYLLIAANVLIFLSYSGLMADPRALGAFFGEYAMIPARVASGDGSYTLITSMFLHGGVMHLAGNMLFLWIFGDNLEDEMGFLAFYLASGVGAALAHLGFSAGSTVPTVGASGAIAGVLGGYLLLYPRAKVDILFIIVVIFRVVPVPAWLMLGLWFAMQVFNGVGADPTTGGVAYWAHAGGFVVGFVLTLPVFLKRGGPAYWNRTLGRPPNPEATYSFSRSSVPTVPRRPKRKDAPAGSQSVIPRVRKRRPRDPWG